MTEEIAGAISSESGTGIDVADIKDPIPPDAATGADTQKPDTPDATDENAEPKPDTPEQQEAKKQSRFQRQRDRQRAAVVAAQTEARLLREQNAQLQARLQPPANAGEPKRENYQDYEQYLDARTDYRAEQKAAAILRTQAEAQNRANVQRQATQGQQQIAQDWTAKEKAYSAEVKDYEATVTPYVEDALGDLSDAAKRQILEAGPQLLDHLARNPDVHDGIAELSPRDQKAELARLSQKLAAKPAARLPDAPAPIKPVRQGPSGGQGYRENMSDAEYATWRKSQGARWARNA